MGSLILFSLYSNDLLKYKDCVIKTYFQRRLDKEKLLHKELIIHKEKFHL